MTTKIVRNWDTPQSDYEFRDDEDVRSEAQATHSHRYHNHLLFLHNLEHHLFKGVYAVDAYPTMLKYVTYLHEKEDPLWDILTDHYACFNIMAATRVTSSVSLHIWRQISSGTVPTRTVSLTAKHRRRQRINHAGTDQKTHTLI